MKYVEFFYEKQEFKKRGVQKKSIVLLERNKVL